MKKILALALAALAVPVAVSAAKPAETYDAPIVSYAVEEEWDDVITFDDEAEVRSKFIAHFCSEQNIRRADDLLYSWRLNDGVLERTNNVDPARDTINIAILTYTGKVYGDFELSVDYQRGNKTNFWPVVGIRQQSPGLYYTTPGGGGGVFMQNNGKISMWGPLLGGLQETAIPGTYQDAGWHNMRIRAEGKSVTVFIDAVEVYTFTVNDLDYTKGYISLQSVNNNCSYDNFKIRALGSESSGDKVAENEPNRSPYAEDGTPLDDYIK